MWATQRFEDSDVFFGHGCDNPRDEAIWVTLQVAGLMNRSYHEVADYPITQQEVATIDSLIQKRITTRQPLAYLLRESWFGGYSFYIDERAIVPRSPIGDLIQDGFAPWIETPTLHRALDLCCGSGCIAIALALTFPHLKVDAADIDSDALAVARINVNRHQVSHRVAVLQSDLFENLPNCIYDLIVTNPPYIATPDLNDLPQEYQHEPRAAFAGGEDGLRYVRQILRQAGRRLSDKGHLLIELGGSAGALEAAYPEIPFLWLTGRNEESVVALLSRRELAYYNFV